MKKIGFIGAYDKTDFILYIARIITEMNKTVLIVDTTITQKAKYVVPTIRPTKAYFTEYEKIDVAVGFDSMTKMLDYLGLDENMELNYDYVLIDVDSYEAYNEFKLRQADLNFFVTSFDLYSLKKGLEVLSGLRENTRMIKVLFSKNMSKEENEYLDFLASNYPVKWENDIIYFPFDQGDQSIIIENQRVSKIKLRNLSAQFKDSLLIMASHITGNSNLNEFKKILKTIEKGV